MVASWIVKERHTPVWGTTSGAVLGKEARGKCDGSVSIQLNTRQGARRPSRALRGDVCFLVAQRSLARASSVTWTGTTLQWWGWSSCLCMEEEEEKPKEGAFRRLAAVCLELTGGTQVIAN